MSSRVYIEIKNYREVLDAIDVVKSRIIVAKQLLHELHSIRSEENKEMSSARQRLVQMEAVLAHLESEVFTS